MKYFGTDGIRGEWGKGINNEIAYKVGLALCDKFGKGEYIVGRDTRVSGKTLQDSIVQGLIDKGATVLLVGVLPTPAIAYMTMIKKARAGIMLSASHNPPSHNGIKIFASGGIKLEDSVELEIEQLIDSYKGINNSSANSATNSVTISGIIKHLRGARGRYIKHLCKSIGTRFDGISVALDCAYGAASTVAKRVFVELGANVSCHNSEIKGSAINVLCGAMYPDNIANITKKHNIDIGFAFDGDADRLVFAFKGKPVDGDTVLYLLSQVVVINKNTVVATILNNTGLQRQLQAEGIELVRTAVGDKHIIDNMLENDYSLGGEQSGHYIIRPYSTTGDGILAAMFLLKSLYGKNNQLIKNQIISLPLLPLVVQKSISLDADASIMQSIELLAVRDKWNSIIGDSGRLIIRMSGTEPKIRIMCECDNAELATQAIKELEECVLNVNN